MNFDSTLRGKIEKEKALSPKPKNQESVPIKKIKNLRERYQF
jgi:hypothetical protein